MFQHTRRCTIVHAVDISSAQVQERLRDVSGLFANGFIADGLNWTAFPVRGPSRRMGGDQKMLAQVRKRLADVDARIGVADTAFAALVAALSDVGVVEAGADGSLLTSLPLVVTAQIGVMPAAMVHTLGQLGYKTLGSIAAVEQVLLRDRFGPDGVRLWHLSNGNEIDYTEFSEPHEEIVSEVSFEEPLHLAEQIVFGVRAAVEEIVERLGRDSQLCTQFTLTLETEHSELSERIWQFTRGFNARSMIERARWQLDEWLHSDPQQITAGVCLARFVVRATRPAHSEQLTLWGDHSGTDTDAVRLAGKIASTHGPDAVTIAQWRGGRDATQMFAFVPALDLDLADAEITWRMQHPSKHEGPWSGVLPSPLPTLVREPAEVVALCDEREQSVGVTRRSELTAIPHRLIRADGTSFSVLTWAGPWPIEERWWMPEESRRVVQMQLVVTPHSSHELQVPETALLLVMSAGAWRIVAEYA